MITIEALNNRFIFVYHWSLIRQTGITVQSDSLNV